MKLRYVLLGAGVCAAGVALVTGFPHRVGASRLEAELRLPGDDILPDAPVVVDRAVDIDATPGTVWSVLNLLLDEDEEMFVHSTVENQALILASNDVEDDLVGTRVDSDATWAFVITARADGTTRLHLRERQQPHNGRALVAAWADTTLGAVAMMRVLRDVKAIAEMEEEVFLMEASEEAERTATSEGDA